MVASALKVYLDHHIKRDNLLYKPSQEQASEMREPDKFMKIQDLAGRPARSLRKPDFQRATWAWTPKECVDLLEAVLEDRVVPSVIMWLSPQAFQYVLDGGHRISVLLAWIKDDWGDRLAVDIYQKDLTLERDARRAAIEVRRELRERGIGSFEEHTAAAERYDELDQAGRVPALEMDRTSLKFAEVVRRWDAGSIGFPVLWVKGGYQRAEESFLKINKSGRRLSDWETKLVENRGSSFARCVVSIAQVYDAEHCWPTRDPEVGNDPAMQTKINELLDKIRELHNLLFIPPYYTPINHPTLPLLAVPFTRPELKPAYLSEVLTITEGKKGSKPETESLIRRNVSALPKAVITEGYRTIENALDVIGNIYGSGGRSLMLMPIVYFYNPQGVYVRSLFYGMLYWLNYGNENIDVLNRKRLFTAHRRAFETTILRHKNTIVNRITRRIGSGAEVTYPTARYYDGLLRLLIEHEDKIDTSEFKTMHDNLVETLGKPSSQQDAPRVSTSRTFRGRQRQGVNVADFLDRFASCEICGGRYYPGLFTEVDHRNPHKEGGLTTIENARNTHPFCNNSREAIEKIRNGVHVVSMPDFENPANRHITEQLSFLNFIHDANDDDDDAILGDDTEEDQDTIV